MWMLSAGLGLFLGVHSISIFSRRWRDRAVERIGYWTFKGLYSLLALCGLILIVQGYGQARLNPVWLYHPPTWMAHLTLVLMVPVFPALLAAYFPGRIADGLRHPMLVAVKLWAVAHLLANGTLADLLLFGGLLTWAIADRISLRRRPAGVAPQMPRTAINDALVVIGGIVLYVIFVRWLHPAWIGVPVLS